MSRTKSVGFRALWLRWWRMRVSTEGAQIVELAVSLPLLALIFVGTYDVGQAFNVKQKLVATTREAARFATNQPMRGLTDTSSGTCSAPTSVCATRDLIDSYLSAAGVNDCGLGSTSANPSTTFQWEFDASTGCGGTFKVIINRGYTYTTTSKLGTNNVTVTVEATHITMSYPYQWQFNRFIQILGGNIGVSPIPTSAVMRNLD